MQHQTIPLTELRLKLASFCQSVRQGKTELTITRYDEPFFKIIMHDDFKADVVFGLTHMRDRIGEFEDTLQEHKTVLLTNRNRPFVKCVLL